MEKLEKLREMFSGLGIDGMIITSPSNRRYMTNFTGTAGITIISESRSLFFTDSRYIDQAKEQAFNYEVILYKRTFSELTDYIKSMGIQKLGFEKDYATYSQFKELSEVVPAELVPVGGAIEKLRAVKTDEEISYLKTAAEIADKAFSQIVKLIRPGVTEIEVANQLEMMMRSEGATSSGSMIIVASGYRSALPHGVASEKAIGNGDMVTLDFGAYYKGYRSDMTRTVAVGEPISQLKEIYQIVFDAIERGVSGIRPGLTTGEVDALARDYISSNGYGNYYGHGGGHGIGLDIHEDPFFSPKGESIVKPGMVVTVEPGIYLPGIGGVRIEDDVLITQEGFEILTHSPKELIRL
jgi:Xaa-Pro aminopeptidase